MTLNKLPVYRLRKNVWGLTVITDIQIVNELH